MVWDSLGEMTRAHAWRVLRGMRANPPGMASTNRGRHAVFTAALEQGQQFMEAAAVTGYATRPVQLFYGLSQLGCAIAAAATRLPDTEPATGKPGEGLREARGRPASTSRGGCPAMASA